MGNLPLDIPRDRNGSFAPTLIKKRQRRLKGFDDKVVALYARGLTTLEIQGHLEEVYGVEISPTLISNITDAVLEDVRIWQSRPLDAVYPILYFDCLFVKSRQEGVVTEGRLCGLRGSRCSCLRTVSTALPTYPMIGKQSKTIFSAASGTLASVAWM